MQTLENSLLKLTNIKVIDQTIDYKDYIALDLSVSNIELSKIDIKNPTIFNAFIENLFQESDTKVAILFPE